MGELSDLLQRAAGEVSNRSAIARWRQAVSQSLDSVAALLGIGTSEISSALSPDFGWVKRGGSTQAGVGANTTLDLNVEGAARGIEYVNATSSWVLNAGKRYRLTVHGRFANFSNATGGSMRLRFVDDANAPLQDTSADSPDAFFHPTTHTTADSSSAGLEMIYTVPMTATPTQRTVKLRVTDATGTADLPSNGMTWVVEEIPGGVS